ncbi:MAG: hypothetical protein M1832_002951 [Thelocarpon impressellum]|nr:MAG: hypothetical protein M1832_002951 [Thelocarpon impressellum]
MAWRSSGSTNATLIENLYINGLIKSPRVKDAMLAVDRAHFAPTAPHQDAPQTIGHGATVSAPHMHASSERKKACESLLPHLSPTSRVLDIGSGSGYLTAVLAHLVSPGGSVIGVDHIRPLVELAEKNVAKSAEGRRMLAEGRVRFVRGDGRAGWAEGSHRDGEGTAEDGYDAIHVGAAAGEVHPALIEQLRAPGRMFIPVQDSPYGQNVWVVDKLSDGSVRKERLYGVSYVPLTDEPGK